MAELNHDLKVIDSVADAEDEKDSNNKCPAADGEKPTGNVSSKPKATTDLADTNKGSNSSSEDCKNCQTILECDKASAEKKNEKSGSDDKARPAQKSRAKESEIEKQKQPDYLIITEDEEDLDMATDNTKNEEDASSENLPRNNDVPTENKRKDSVIMEISETPAAKKKESLKHVWVSNVNRGVKACDLKKLFSAHAKVTTAKVMTNGKRFFGYICFETIEMAETCVKEFHNTKLAGKRIAVSLQRPDLKVVNSRTEDIKRITEITIKKEKEEVPCETIVKAPLEKPTVKVEHSPKMQPSAKEKEEVDHEKSQQQRRSRADVKVDHEKTETPKRSRSGVDSEHERNQLLKRLRAAQADMMTYKKRLSDCQNELQIKTDRCRNLRKDLEKITDQLHSERRRLTQERDQFKEKQKMEQIRFDTDRTMLNKEIDECKKLREYLQSKINELSDSRKRKAKSRSPVFRRSPPTIRRDIRHNPPRGRHDLGEKKGRFEPSKERNRTPPPPPKLSADKSLSRSHDTYSAIKVKSSQPRHSPPTAIIRGHYLDSNRRSENSRSAVPPPPSVGHSRNPLWQTNYPNPVWRSSYGDDFQGPPATPARENMFYPNFGKSHPGLDNTNRRY